jgi:hypothetical protein
MATRNPEYGNNLILEIGGVQLTNLLSNGFEPTREFRDVTTKDSGDWSESRPTTRSVTIPFEGLFSKSSPNGYEEIYDAWSTGQLLNWKLTTGVVGDTIWTGAGFIESCSLDAPNADNVTFSGSITVTGEVTKGVEV